MILSDYHVHTTYCDGSDTPRRIVEEAIKLGIKELGFSVHSWTEFDQRYCIEKDKVADYVREINDLKVEFYDKIKIYCGVELDYYSDMDVSDFDYVIGSCHYLKVNGKYYEIDESAEDTERLVREQFNGDYYALCEEYYRIMSDLINKTKANIIGHFDIISKFNDKNKIFYESQERYKKAYKNAIDLLINNGVPFEVNLGAVNKGLKAEPYPSKDILGYLAEKNAKVILSSDSHSHKTLCKGFDSWQKILNDKGLKLVDTIFSNSK